MKRNNLIKVLKKIYKLLDTKQKLRFILIIIIMIVSATLAQMTPKAIGWLTDDILTKNEISFNKVIPFLVFILIVNVANEVIKIFRRVLVEDTATRTEKKARGMVIKSLLMAPLSYFRKNMTGNIHGRLNRCLDGTIKLEKLLFMDFAPAIFNAIAAIITIFLTLPITLAMPMLLVIPIGVFIVLKQIKSQKGIRVELLESKSGMDGTIVELINGIEVIRICDSLDFETKRFDDKGEFLRAKEMKHHKAMAMYDCLKFINQAVFTVLVIGISTYLATKNIISVGAVLTAYLCFNQLLRPLEELHRIFDEVSECTVLATDFFKMVEIENDFSYLPIKTKSENKTTNEIINMENITFYYSENEDKIILDNFNIDIEKGMYLGIAGPSGCGKSSLIKSICKLEKAEGTIIVDDKNIDNLTRKDLSKLIALVPQSPFLIAGTIFENITYGIDREVSIDEVEEAAKRAYIYDYINGLPDKFDSLVSEGGNNLSGGQRQRIAIARIFLRKPKILILDEATSALDNTSEKYIQAEIEKMKQENNTTIIAIAHRLTTLKNCDRIIVLNKGKIEEDGKFDDLIEKNGMFSDMYYGKLN
ncbi:MAG: ABC transporter ATP-binding protein [Mollicutes bacterium]|nr:ABC transporter ATP-binding protein [Mollicutes bacterium]MDY5875491.1 ABC transporter ATP-binding protein [Bacilli bacterium]